MSLPVFTTIISPSSRHLIASWTHRGTTFPDVHRPSTTLLGNLFYLFAGAFPPAQFPSFGPSHPEAKSPSWEPAQCRIPVEKRTRELVCVCMLASPTTMGQWAASLPPTVTVPLLPLHSVPSPAVSTPCWWTPSQSCLAYWSAWCLLRRPRPVLLVDCGLIRHQMCHGAPPIHA